MKSRLTASRLHLSVLVSAAAAGAPVASSAQAGSSEADALAKALSNPVAALISVPLQLNYDSGLGGEGNGERWTMNVQPVIPFGLSKDWNLISRTILPVIEQTDVIPGDRSQSGIGDVTQSLFFSPKAPTASGWIWGVGPAFLLPTASEDVLGAEQWGVGPTAVMLKQTEDGWTYGALVNHLVSVAGDEDRDDVNSTFMQPFLSRSLGQGATATINFESTYDWESRQWNVPLNLSYTKVIKLGDQRLSLAGGPRVYLEAPEGGADWGVRLVVTLLFPK